MFAPALYVFGCCVVVTFKARAAWRMFHLWPGPFKNTHTARYTSLHCLYTLTQRRKWHVVKSIFKCGNNKVSSKHPNWGVWLLKLMNCCFLSKFLSSEQQSRAPLSDLSTNNVTTKEISEGKKSPQDPHCCYPKNILCKRHKTQLHKIIDGQWKACWHITQFIIKALIL